MGVLLLALAVMAACCVVLGLFAEVIERWLFREDAARTTEPPTVGFDPLPRRMTRPGRRA